MLQPLPFVFNIGDHVEEVLHGIKGPVVGRAQHITGCNTYGILPPLKKDEVKSEVLWFDETRIKLIKANAVKLPEHKPSTPAVAPSGRSRGADFTPPSRSTTL